METLTDVKAKNLSWAWAIMYDFKGGTVIDISTVSRTRSEAIDSFYLNKLLRLYDSIPDILIDNKDARNKIWKRNRGKDGCRCGKVMIGEIVG